MATIIQVTDLPAAIQTADSVALMVAGVNAQASRIAPCLIPPTSAAWASATVYALGARVKLAENQYLEVTVAGTSGAVAPVVPERIGNTVVDGSVTWKRIAPTSDQSAEARLVLVGAVKRWVEIGAGALQQQTAGPFGMTVDTRQRTGWNLRPSEIDQLQSVCKGEESASAYAVDTSPVSTDWSAYQALESWA